MGHVVSELLPFSLKATGCCLLRLGLCQFLVQVKLLCFLMETFDKTCCLWTLILFEHLCLLLPPLDEIWESFGLHLYWKDLVHLISTFYTWTRHYPCLTRLASLFWWSLLGVDLCYLMMVWTFTWSLSERLGPCFAQTFGFLIFIATLSEHPLMFLSNRELRHRVCGVLDVFGLVIPIIF